MSAGLLASCAKIKQAEPITRQYKVITTTNPYVGKGSSKNTIYNVRDREIVKEYVISPYVDPNNPNVRMPGGAMHVMTRPSRWNSEPNTQHGMVVEPQYARVKEVQNARLYKAAVQALKAKNKSMEGQLLDARLQSRKISLLEKQVETLEAKNRNNNN